MDSAAIQREIIRILLYVAWADGEIVPEEYDYILRMARNAKLSKEDIAEVDGALRDSSKVVKPNVEALKPFRQEVLAAAQELIACDDVIAPGETDILHKLASLLA